MVKLLGKGGFGEAHLVKSKVPRDPVTYLLLLLAFPAQCLSTEFCPAQIALAAVCCAPVAARPDPPADVMCALAERSMAGSTASRRSTCPA